MLRVGGKATRATDMGRRATHEEANEAGMSFVFYEIGSAAPGPSPDLRGSGQWLVASQGTGKRRQESEHRSQETEASSSRRGWLCGLPVSNFEFRISTFNGNRIKPSSQLFV